MSEQDNLPVPVETPFMPMELEKIKQAVHYTEQFVKEVLNVGKPGSGDYGVIPGTGNKPTLFKSGAEKLCMAFSLAAEYEIQDKVTDHDREWEYQVYDKKAKQYVAKKTTGWYSYTCKCNLVNRETGIVWGTQLGVCDSSERGREDASANTCLKMAQKRALVGATLNATMTSDRFTCDVEDGGHKKSGAQPSGGQQEDGEIERRMKSRFDNGKCGFCGEKHIPEGSEIVLVNKTWGSEECYNAAHATNSGQADNPPTDQENVPQGGPTAAEQAELDAMRD
jgi:hypothetical protein